MLRSVDTIRIFTRDLGRARRFYGDMLALETERAEPSFAIFVLDGVRILVEQVASDDAEGQGLVGRFLGVSFRVDDAHSAYRRLKERGVDFVQAPEKQTWGGVLAFARDPDGNVLTLVSG